MSDTETSSLVKVLNAMGVLPKPEDIERDIAALRAKRPSDDPKQLSRRVVYGATARMTGAGVVAALPGAIPGLGTRAQAVVTGSTITGETWLLLRNLTAMHLTVAGLHGLDVHHPNRLDELAIVWGLETGLIIPVTEAGKRVGTKIGVKQFNQRVSGEIFKKINRRLGTTVLTKVGTKRGGVAVGRLIPFGVGSAVGGGMNYLTSRSFGAALVRYYEDLLPGNEDVVVLG